MSRPQATLLLAFTAVSISCGSETLVEPEPQQQPPQPPVIAIISVRVIPSTHTAAVGGTATMSALVSTQGGKQYTLKWSLAEETNTAKIDAETGVLTAVASGFAYPRACATASLADGQTQTVCGETTIRIVTSLTPIASRGLAFVRNGSIFASGPDDSPPVPLITEAGRPAWSPDGTRIAFTRPTTNVSAKWQLCIASQDGSDIRCATGPSNGHVLGKPSWSPDGLSLAFAVFTDVCLNGKCWQLGGSFASVSILNTVTMQTKSLATPPAWSVSWSPDGRKIAFATFGMGAFGRGALATVNPDGSGLNILAMSLGTYSVHEMAWSPDASRLALSLLDEHACPWYCNTALGIVNADGTELKVLDQARTCFFDPGCANDEAYIWGAPEWSLDGARVTYTLTRGGDCFADERVSCGTDIMVAGVDERRIEFLMTGAGLPSWRH